MAEKSINIFASEECLLLLWLSENMTKSRYKISNRFSQIDIAKELDIQDFKAEMLYNPEINIMLGTKYFDKLLSKYDENYYLAIAAYNAGIGNVDGWISRGVISSDASNIENIPYRETNLYVRKTVKAYTVYSELYC